MDAPILVLSVGTMRPAADGAAPRGAADAGACCKACQETDGCNGWSFCSREAGCGSQGACTAYNVATRQSGAGAEDAYPVTGFGAFNGKLKSCGPDGRWPDKTCRLWGAVGGTSKAPRVMATGGCGPLGTPDAPKMQAGLSSLL